MAKYKSKSVQIKEALINQLKAKGADLPQFEGLINDYVNYYKIVEEMKKDIKKRGISFMSVSAAGKEYEKDNPNVKLLPQYTKTMLLILKELGLTTDTTAECDDEL